MELIVVLAVVLIIFLLLKKRKEGFVISFPNSDGWTYDHLYYSADRTTRHNHRGYQINNLQGVTPRDKLFKGAKYLVGCGKKNVILSPYERISVYK